MHSINTLHSLPKNQQGATLVVALIMLVLISLIGVSTLKSATVVEKMSAADYQKNVTFRASESAVEVALQEEEYISETIRTGTKELDNVAIDVAGAEADVFFQSVGESYVDGASLDTAAGQRIMITSTGTVGEASTRTLHGVVRIVPAL